MSECDIASYVKKSRCESATSPNSDASESGRGSECHKNAYVVDSVRVNLFAMSTSVVSRVAAEAADDRDDRERS